MKIKELREKHGYSQAQIAKYLSLSRPAVNKYENSGVKPPIDKLIALADLYGVSLDELVGRDFHASPSVTPSDVLTDQMRGIVCFYGNKHYFMLSEEGQRRVDDYIDDLYHSDRYTEHPGSIVIKEPFGENVVLSVPAHDTQDNADQFERIANAVEQIASSENDPTEKKA